MYEHMEYTPYGELWVEHGPQGLETVPYRFTGKELDNETGLYYYGARYLNPRTSRWISADPAMERYLPEVPLDNEARQRNSYLPGLGGIFNSLNLAAYHYAGNNPIKYVDPSGEDDVGAVAERSRIEIIVTRNIDPQAYQSEKPPAPYQDTLEVRKGGESLLTIPVQSSASLKMPTYKTKEGQTIEVENLSEGHHIAVAEAYSAGDKPKFKDILRIDNSAILVHPNMLNARKGALPLSGPFSAGCTVPRIADFEALTETLRNAGVVYNGTRKIDLEVRRNY